ncbi:hypothetical protein BJV82DRAFT_668139 [Fennellomyces sp. T-0311]|nr:hypothetical protein BJV82DRAFT_668139 [Fennellomyces sp. T-0311]
MAMVKHRFAEIHQAYAADETEKLWTTLTNPDLSVIAVSSVCDKIVASVQAGSFRFKDTILHLQNLVLTSNNRLKTSVYLRSITLLLQCHAQLKEFHDAIDLVLTSSPTGIVHPFIVICRQRPELGDDVFFEVDFLLAQYDESYDYSLLDSMGTFFDSVLLAASNAQRMALLHRFANTYPSTALRAELYYYLVDVLQRYPTRRAMSFYLQLVDYISTVFTSPEVPEDELRSIATTVFYQLLCRAYDAATYGYPSLPYLQRLDRVYGTRDICSDQPLTAPNFYLIWTSLSYLLLTTQTVHDQQVVLKMMQEAIRRNKSSDKTLLVAILPLLQTWTEIVENDAAAKQRKSSTLEMLAQVTENASIEVKDKAAIKNDMIQELEEYGVTGAMANMIPYLFHFLDNQLDDTGVPTNSVSHIHALMFTAPYVFHTNTNIRHSNLKRLADLSSVTTGTYSFKFSVFLLTLYLMRSKDIMTSETFLFIYHTVIPTLVDVNDPTTTAKILQTVLPMIQGSHSSQARGTAMAAVGFKTLVSIFERQPRVWHEVKRAMANWILHRKSTLRPDDKLAIQMELAVLTSMRDLCKTRPRTCAQDILPMVSRCFTAGLAEPRSMWNVAISYIAAFAMEREQDMMVVLWTKMCDFFAIVGDVDEVSESYYEFKDDVLFNYIEPLMSSEITSIRSSALTALSHFSASDIMCSTGKVQAVHRRNRCESNDADTKVLAQLLSHELDHMRRNLFKEDAPSKPKVEETKDVNTKRCIGTKEADLAGRFVKAWEQAGTAPGVRAGYAIAVLHTTAST